VLVYSAILLAIVTALGVSLWLRVPLKVDVIRDRGALARMVEMGRIENVYRVQFMNASEAERELQVTVDGLPGVTLASEPTVHLRPTEVRSVPVRVQVPPGLEPGSHPIVMTFRTADGTIEVREKTTFLIPR
ncbi:MAG: cytochrome c oxidase accessory protein CcoG, partial [Tepidimonas taiwanensis]|nr:cytochrome c oxidase accessory protein CcoG [Tepidimonas taiwanensis]